MYGLIRTATYQTSFKLRFTFGIKTLKKKVTLPFNALNLTSKFQFEWMIKTSIDYFSKRERKSNCFRAQILLRIHHAYIKRGWTYAMAFPNEVKQLYDVAIRTNISVLCAYFVNICAYRNSNGALVMPAIQNILNQKLVNFTAVQFCFNFNSAQWIKRIRETIS